jgi:hypothetical protein
LLIGGCCAIVACRSSTSACLAAISAVTFRLHGGLLRERRLSSGRWLRRSRQWTWSRALALALGVFLAFPAIAALLGQIGQLIYRSITFPSNTSAVQSRRLCNSTVQIHNEGWFIALCKCVPED